MTRKTKNVEDVTIRFAGDSGDGMQLTGTQFTNTTAIFGNDLSTLPDYPAEIRAPQGTTIRRQRIPNSFRRYRNQHTGRYYDVLVAMNAAALQVNLRSLIKGGSIIVNTDGFNEKNLKLAGYSENPLHNQSLADYLVYEVDITELTSLALQDLGLTTKIIDRSKNFFALGMMYSDVPIVP